MKLPPKVSIIIPVYNLASIVSKSIESCINQTFKDIEIVIVNDGSTDGSELILGKYKNIDSRIKVLNKQNEGVNLARRDGINMSSGEFVFFLDADDTIPADAIQALVEQSYNPKVDIVAGNVCLFKDENVYTENLYSDFNSGSGTHFLEYILTNSLHYLVGKIIRRSLFVENEIGFPKDLTLGEDQVVLFQLCMFVNRVDTTDKVVYNYLVNNDSVTQRQTNNTVFTKAQENYAYALHELQDKFPYNDLVRQQINLRILKALYFALHRSGQFVINKKRSRKLMLETLNESVFSRKTLFKKHYQLLGRCFASFIYPKLAFRLRSINET